MTWEEKLLFLMFLDYKGALGKWEKNNNDCYFRVSIDSSVFNELNAFNWTRSPEGYNYWDKLIYEWRKISLNSFAVSSLSYEIKYKVCENSIEVGCQSITKEDALKIADFIYECFEE